MKGRVLVIDDDEDVLKAARLALLDDMSDVDFADSSEALAARLATRVYDVVLLDMNLSVGKRDGREGLELLGNIRLADPTLSVILMTSYGAVGLAIDALKQGGLDFVLKPWNNEKLVATVSDGVAQSHLRRGSSSCLDLKAIEQRAIAAALKQSAGNLSRAAAILGLTRPALYRRMAKHGL